MTDQKPKIFLSYAREDMGMAKKIYNDLKRYGLDIWFDNESLLPGQDWNFEIEKAIEESKYFLAVLSSKSIDKVGYIQNEIKAAIERRKYYPKGKIYIIPIRLNDCIPIDKEIKELQWIDVFPECEYQNGLKKILRVVFPHALYLRNQPGKFSYGDVSDMIRKNNFFDKRFNPEGKGCPHLYEMLQVNGDKVIIDKHTGLIWQRGGSVGNLEWGDSKNWIERELNEKCYANYNTWRLPTVEEAMSLMEPIKSKEDLYIDCSFNKKQAWIWTSDLIKNEHRPWDIDFSSGFCSPNLYTLDQAYVRAVCDGQ